jgi:hypothetical protein
VWARRKNPLKFVSYRLSCPAMSTDVRLNLHHLHCKVGRHYFRSALFSKDNAEDSTEGYRSCQGSLPRTVEGYEEMTERFASVWDAVSANPQEAKVMRMRAELMSDIRDFIKAK